jgi:hypothetical protein
MPIDAPFAVDAVGVLLRGALVRVRRHICTEDTGQREISVEHSKQNIQARKRAASRQAAT